MSEAHADATPVALVTGSAARVGATILEALHDRKFNVCLHYRGSREAAEALSARLNGIRPDSCLTLRADLGNFSQCENIIGAAHRHWGRLDVLVNNASAFYPTPVGTINEHHWDDLMAANVKGPLFLSQAAAPHLRETQGNIVNLIDIYAERPLKEHTVYCIAKAGIAMLTKSLAQELGPRVRVNGVAPGAILWPEAGKDDEQKREILKRVALKRAGEPDDIAQTVVFLATSARYISGQIIAVDGGAA